MAVVAQVLGVPRKYHVESASAVESAFSPALRAQPATSSTGATATHPMRAILEASLENASRMCGIISGPSLSSSVSHRGPPGCRSARQQIPGQEDLRLNSRETRAG